MLDRPGMRFEELQTLIKESFPNLKCLRCGHDEFYLGQVVVGDNTWLSDEVTSEVARLVCRRCGNMEQHSVSVLQRADRPIEIS